MNPSHLLSCSLQELRSYDRIEQVDIICSAFEESWKNGTQLNIRECVSWVEPIHQKEVLHELILVEKECREFHPPIAVEAPNEFLVFDSKYASAGTLENFSSDTVRTESKPFQLPLYIDRFAIVKLIGKGSFGDVYEAEDVSIHRRVAVKVAMDSRKSLRTFAKEAENANRVGHPSIVRIYDVGNWRGIDYLVSELIDGTPLGPFREASGLHPTGCARIVAEIADAIAAAHVEGVVHRDLKPSNIMIEVADRSVRKQSHEIVQDPLFEKHRVRVLDFGISKLDGRDTKLTRTGDILGTPHYMSPEQAAGRADSVDGRSDIYSIGVILFELLTGKLPFEGPESVVINSIRLLKAPRVQSLRPEVPATLDLIVKRCLETDPANRYQTATELASDLEAWIEGRKPRSIALAERRRLAAGITWTVAACLLIVSSTAAIQLLPSRGGQAQLVSNLPSSTDMESTTSSKRISSWVRQGQLADLASWLVKANATSDALVFSELDDLKLAGELSNSEANRLEFVRVCIADASPTETESNDVLLGFIQELELSQVDSLADFLQTAPSWMIGSFVSLPKTDLEDPKRSYLYRGLAQRLRSNGDGERLLELLRLSESAELSYVLSCMMETVSGNTEWRTRIRDRFDNAKMSSRQNTAELDSVGRWKAKCALVAYGLGEWSIVDEVLGFSQTPQARNYFIYWLNDSKLSLEPLLERMGQYDDDWRSTGVVAAVSLVSKTGVEPAMFDSLTDRFKMWYRAHPSAGVHTGIRLMLQKWGHNEYVHEVDASPEFRSIVSDRNWYMNSQGMQMSIVRGPVDFWFGNSPTAKVPGSKQRIDYSFAYSDQVVNEVQFARFRPDRFPSPKEHPAVGINFFESVAYCDWLSSQEGLSTVESIKWIDERKYELNFLEGGYRPPTVWEWECFARAGTSTSFVFGETDAEYAKSKHHLTSFGPFFHDIRSTKSEWTSTTVRSAKSAANNTELDSSFSPIWQRTLVEQRDLPRPSKPTEGFDSMFRVVSIVDLQKKASDAEP